MTEFDVVIRAGTAATAADVFRTDIGVRAGRIAALAVDLPSGRSEIDANGLLALPGGVDAHCHLDQPTGDESVRTDDYTPYQGMRVLGRPVTTVSRGEILWSDGQFHAPESHGRFLRCDPPQSIPAPQGQEA
jgi:dihydropyrimidinase